MRPRRALRIARLYGDAALCGLFAPVNCKNMEKEGVVFSYNNDQFRHTEYPAKEGDVLDWKRNGQRGSVKSVVVGFSAQKPDSVLVFVGGKRRWIKKRSVIRVLT